MSRHLSRYVSSSYDSPRPRSFRQKSLLLWALVALVTIITMVAPAQAKGMPTFFTIEGPGIDTPLPFVMQPLSEQAALSRLLSIEPKPSGGIFDLFDVSEALSVDEETLGQPYIIKGYVVLEEDGEQRLFEDLLTPLYYFPQEEGPGIVKHLGPENVYSEYTNHFYTIGEPLENAVQQALILARWEALRTADT